MNRVAELDALVTANDWIKATAIQEFEVTEDAVVYVALRCEQARAIAIKKMHAVEEFLLEDRLLANLVPSESGQTELAALAEGKWKPVRSAGWAPTDIALLERWRADNDLARRILARRSGLAVLVFMLGAIGLMLSSRFGAGSLWTLGALAAVSIGFLFASTGLIHLCATLSIKRTIQRGLEDAKRALEFSRDRP